MPKTYCLYEERIKLLISKMDVGDVFTYDELMNCCGIEKRKVEEQPNEQRNFSYAFVKIAKTGIITKIKIGHQQGVLTKWMKTK